MIKRSRRPSLSHRLAEGGEPSLIVGLTRKIAADQGVDQRRIHVAGMSAGGAMAVILGQAHGTGHAWTGGRAKESYTDGSGPDASREMLRFFLSQSLARGRHHARA